MPAIKIFKVTTLPAILEGHSIYLVAPAAKPNHVEVYVTSADASAIKRIVNIDDIQSMINSSIAASNAFEIVDTIADRDALSLTGNKFVLVLDATGDPTVTSGAATYAWRSSRSTWVKISEYESLDVVLDWASIQNKPTSSVANIDAAVAMRHGHGNFTELSKISETTDGDFQYSNNYPRARLEVADW
jgi:hypothetical protein